MGWQDAPVVSASAQPAWATAPVVGAATAPSRPIDPLRQTALVGRAAGEGVVGTLASPLDFQETFIAPVRNAILQKFGVQLPDLTITSLLKRGLDAAGAPNPETPGEQMGSAITRGVTGALTGAGAGGATGLVNAIRAGASGATSAGASEFVRQKGYGPGAQMAAGVVGGLAPGLAEGAVRTAINSVKPLTASGQQGIAGRVIAANATHPEAAAQNLENAQPIVPGSMRTTGEASQDVGLLALEKGVRGRNPAAFGQRLSEQNAARQNALSSLAGTPEDITSMQSARNATTGPMREAAFAQGGTADVAPVVQSIDKVLAGPIGKRDIPSSALNWVKGKLTGETDPASLYAVRQDIGDALAGKLGGDAAKFRLARRELMDVRSQLDDAIEQSAPGFKAYLARYSEMSGPIDQAKVLQEIQRRGQLASADVTTGQNFLGTANFSRAVDSALAKAGNKLTSNQVEQLNAIRTDLQYGQAVNSPLIKAPGSDTFQNLSIAQAIGAAGQKIPGVATLITKPLDWIYKLAGSDAGINEALTRAMLDPKLAAMMLRKATPQSSAQFANALRAYVGGAAGAAAASRQQASAATNTQEQRQSGP